MSKEHWKILMDELRDIGNMFGDLLGVGKLGPSNLEISKNRNKEMVALNKKEPIVIKNTFYKDNRKVKVAYIKQPKEKTQKFFNHHTQQRKNEI